MQTQYNDAEQQ